MALNVSDVIGIAHVSINRSARTWPTREGLHPPPQKKLSSRYFERAPPPPSFRTQRWVQQRGLFASMLGQLELFSSSVVLPRAQSKAGLCTHCPSNTPSTLESQTRFATTTPATSSYRNRATTVVSMKRDVGMKREVTCLLLTYERASDGGVRAHPLRRGAMEGHHYQGPLEG